MEFFDTSGLKTDEIMLRLTKTMDVQPEKRWLPVYYFDICLPDGEKIGHCDLRIGHNEKTYIGGNIGYGIDEPWRGHHYAAKACRLLFRLAQKHGMDHLFITCMPDNTASAKTCENAGGRFVEITDIPPDNEMYAEGKRRVRIYRFDIRHRTVDIAGLSRSYAVRPLTEDDADAVFALCRENPQYYEYCPPFVTPDSVRADMRALPPGKEPRDKYYLGFFDEKDLICILDLINGYPYPAAAFLGFFMMAVPYQKKGIGSLIVSELCVALKDQGFEEVRLARVEGNPQPEAFWHKNGFTGIGKAHNTENCSVIVMSKKL